MASSRPRVLVGRFFHESHGFNPRPTTAEQFEIDRGAGLIKRALGSGTTLGGIVGRLTALDCEIVPGISVSAPPSGLIDHDFLSQMVEEFITILRRERCDAVALELHGAMSTTELPDADGDVLFRIRVAAGHDIPICVGLDLHAHVTRAMLRASDICIACKENPHADVVQCGERVVDCLMAVLDRRLKPVTAMAKVPMLLLGGGETAFGPLAELHAHARALQASHPAIWDISLYNVYRHIDDVHIGQAAVVLANDDGEAARIVAVELAALFWRWRERFRDDFLTIDQAFEIIEQDRARRPYVVADFGDRVLGGAPGDSTALLAHALRRPSALRGALPVTDPVSVETARRAGVGATVDLAVGGRFTPGFEPLPLTGVVTQIGDGRFTMAGPYRAGEETSFGNTATVVVAGRLSLILTSKPGFSHDLAAFTSQGIDPIAQDFLVTKSGYHFQLNFAGIATPLFVATPGISYYTPGQVQWKRARFWPEHPIRDVPVEAELFGGSEGGPS